MKTLQQAAQSALDVQDAVNLSGVVHSLDQVVTFLWEEARAHNMATDRVNTHPIVTLYLDKLRDLNDLRGDRDNFEAYQAVKEMAAASEVRS